MEEIFTFIENLNKRLSRPIKDLDDVRGSMAALSEIREAEIRSVSIVEEILIRVNKATRNILKCNDCEGSCCAK